MKSVDGITWTTVTPTPPTAQWRDVVWAKEIGLFVAIGDSGTLQRAMTSPDGNTWTLQTTPAGDYPWQCLVWAADKGLLVALANGTGVGNRCMTSPDGINWTLRAGIADSAWISIAYGGGRFAAGASSGSIRMAWSSDGMTWNSVSPSPSFAHRGMCWSPEMSRFVAVGTTSYEARVAYSADGSSWVQVGANGAKNEYWGVAWSPKLQRWAAVATTQTINDEYAYWEWTGGFVNGDVWRGAINITSISGSLLDLVFVYEYLNGITSFTSTFWAENWTTPGIKRATETATFTGDRIAISAKSDTTCVVEEWGAFKNTATHIPAGTYDFYAFPMNHAGVQGDGAPVVTVTIG